MNFLKAIAICAAVATTIGGGAAFAGETVVTTKTSEGTPLSYTSKSGNFSAYGQATTVYTQPNTAGGNVTPGNQRGSSTSTSYGPGVTIRF